MATQTHTEHPCPSAPEHKERDETLNCNIKASVALQDIDSLFIAALCVLRSEEGDPDTIDKDRKQALETLLEYGRGAVSDAKAGHEGVWSVTAEYLFGRKSTAPEAETAQPEQPA
jgi:hypothetical protein